MTSLRAGFGRRDITPRLGTQLVGYDACARRAEGVHDPLLARALVLEQGAERWALIASDLCFVGHETTQAVRAAVQHRLDIPPDHVWVAATHTHSGPDDLDATGWDRPLAELAADAVEQACATLQPARIGSGFGALYGYSINRRWIERPVDPAVLVVRIDDTDGNPLGLVTGFACHAVVMGSDSRQISADWPGRACQALEQALGDGSTCLFLQGGCGDINPLVAGVRARLQSGHTVVSIGNISAYYGPQDDPARWNIGNRGGGTFAEVDEVAQAFVAEVQCVAAGVRTHTVDEIWSQRLVVDAVRNPDEPRLNQSRPFDAIDPATLIDAQGRLPAEIMLMGVDGLLLVGEPGEVFSETAVRFRTELQHLGYATPFLVGYANGRLDYLPEPRAYDEGGYEVTYPFYMGISRHFQARVWQAVEAALRARTKA